MKIIPIANSTSKDLHTRSPFQIRGREHQIVYVPHRYEKSHFIDRQENKTLIEKETIVFDGSKGAVNEYTVPEGSMYKEEYEAKDTVRLKGFTMDPYLFSEDPDGKRPNATIDLEGRINVDGLFITRNPDADSMDGDITWNNWKKAESGKGHSGGFFGFKVEIISEAQLDTVLENELEITSDDILSDPNNFLYGTKEYSEELSYPELRERLATILRMNSRVSECSKGQSICGPYINEKHKSISTWPHALSGLREAEFYGDMQNAAQVIGYTYPVNGIARWENIKNSVKDDERFIVIVSDGDGKPRWGGRNDIVAFFAIYKKDLQFRKPLVYLEKNSVNGIDFGIQLSLRK